MTGTSWCTATCKPPRNPSSRPWRPLVRASWWLSSVSSPGTWLADLCAEQGLPFGLGHALDMKAIHGGKAKNDQIDSQKIAALLRGGRHPQASGYPAEMRATRDLLRRRPQLMRKRAELLA